MAVAVLLAWEFGEEGDCRLWSCVLVRCYGRFVADSRWGPVAVGFLRGKFLLAAFATPRVVPLASQHLVDVHVVVDGLLVAGCGYADCAIRRYGETWN